MNNKENIVVVGAGLCGGLLALRLAQYGHQISLYEKRGDMRKVSVDSGRSINLALSDRGFRALRMVGLDREIRNICIPMYGRMIHSIEGDLRFSRYSGRSEDYINSVSRTDLNRILLEAADVHDHVSLHFDMACEDIDIEKGKIRFSTNDAQMHVDANVIFGTDGAGSRVRQTLLSKINSDDKQESSEFLTHGYKELSIPPTESGGWRIEKNALHIWPRETFMLIALPNLDGSFTVTLFLAEEGDVSFAALDSDEKIMSFFSTYFSDVLEHMPDLLEDYKNNPVGKLGTLKCYPWQKDGKCLILGDAAHAIVPFYGQGMNASFEDVFVFDQYLKQYGEDWQTIFENYQKNRKKDTDAIADLALDNFHEMRDHVDNEYFVKKRQLEMQLEQQFSDYYSKYSLVTFDEEISYSQALKQGRRQDEILLELCRTNKHSSMDLRDIHDYIRANA